MYLFENQFVIIQSNSLITGKQQTLPIVMSNDKHSILEALISSNNNVWGKFHMHPLKTNMRLATVVAARA